MYTEEDTFNRLRRIPFEQMRLMIRGINRVGIWRKGAALKALEENGWTENEYQLKLAETIIIEAERITKERLEAGQ